MAKKVQNFSLLLIFFSKVEVQKLDICAFLTRLIKPDEKKIILNMLWWEV
jgi:hypothetical protein